MTASRAARAFAMPSTSTPARPYLPISIKRGNMSPAPITTAAARVMAAMDPAARTDDLYGIGGSELYDLMTRGDSAELREILRVARRTDGSVLELACGSGRVTLPLARLGRDVVALDSSQRMRELLAAKARRSGAGTLRIVAGDMSDFRLGETFGLIVLATTSVSLLDPIRRAGLFARVREHLTPHGRFLVSAQERVPHAGGMDTMVVPLPTPEAGVALLSEEVHQNLAYRDVSVVWIRRSEQGVCARAYTSRVQLVDRLQLVDELEAAELRVRGVVPVRAPNNARRVTMIECSR